MNKIKNYFVKIFDSIKESIKCFPLTSIFIFIFTLVFVFAFDSELFSEKVLEHITILLGISGVGTFFSEVLFLKKDKKTYKKIAFYIVNIIIAVIFDVLINQEIFKDATIFRWLFEYIALCILLSIYWLSKKVDKFEKYVLNVYLNSIKNTIVYVITMIGILILFGIFSILIKEIDFEILLKIFWLFTGFYYVPVMLKALIGEEAEDSKFNKTLFKKVFFVLLLLSMIIVYVYLLKIIFITEMPKNEVFMILSFIFVCLAPICIINRNYISDEEKIFGKTIKILPILFIPFILLQIYSMGIRINNYGMTESRYFSIMFIIIELLFCCATIFKDGKYLKELLLAVLFLTTISLVSPINFIEVPIISQKAIVNSFDKDNLEFTELDINEQRKLAGAFKYLENSNVNMEDQFSQKQLEDLRGFNDFYFIDTNYISTIENENGEEVEINNLNYTDDLNGLNISKYSKIYKANYEYNSNDKYNYNTNSYETLTQEEMYQFEVQDINYTIEVDLNLKDFVNEIIKRNIENKYNAERYFEESNIVNCNDKYDYFIEAMDLKVENNTSNIVKISIDGYILEK